MLRWRNILPAPVLITNLAEKFRRKKLAAEINFILARGGNTVESFKFLRKELPTRLMQMIEEMRLLPIMPTPLMDDVYKEFEKSAFEILPFTQDWLEQEVEQNICSGRENRSDKNGSLAVILRLGRVITYTVYKLLMSAWPCDTVRLTPK